MGEAKLYAEERERKRQVTQEEADAYDWWTQFLNARLYAIKCMVKLGKPNEEISRVLSMDITHVQRLKIMNEII